MFTSSSSYSESSPYLRFICGLATGALIFFLVFGFDVLNPANISWLMHNYPDDPGSHYVGWEFFRNEPWNFPLGKIWSYGMGTGGSIVFTDSIPLLAFLLKPFSSILPKPFQYFGIWMLVSMALQGGFALLLAGRFCRSLKLQTVIALFFIISPVMIVRLPFHAALSSHWIILAALLLYYSDFRNHFTYWGVLFSIGTLVHFYLVALIAAIWFTDITHRLSSGLLSWRKSLHIVLSTTAIIFITMWMSGYFIGNQSIDERLLYGKFKMDLSAPFNSMNLSFIVPAVTIDGPELTNNAKLFFDYPENNSEGFNYLGIGVLFLTSAALVVAIAGKSRAGQVRWKKHLPLFAMSVFLIAFAASSTVLFAGREIISANLPAVVVKTVSIFRFSCRFFWPVYYLIMLGALNYCAVAFKSRTALILLITALLLQIGESPHLLDNKIRKYAHNNEWPNPLKDGFWDKSAQRYKKVRFVPNGTNLPGYLQFSYYAAMHSMSINAGNFARQNTELLMKERESLKKAFATGEFDPESLYIFLDLATFRQTSNLLGPKDMLSVVDNIPILAPGWLN